jgi:tRNA threonylcarbamoyl adenosine modification protein (Sua5/YciO/YrdC/YwlC family)
VKLFKSPPPKDLEKLIQKHWMDDTTVLHYTGHMFGIGCRLSSQKAIERILRYKQRSEKNGFIVLIPDIQWLFDHDIIPPAPLLPILNQYWPGNLTVIFAVNHPGFETVAVNGKVAFRVPADNMLRQLIDFLDEPFISTSINVSGIPPAENLQDIIKRYGNWFDLGFLPAQTGLFEPSTIIEYIDVDNGGNPTPPQLKCLRESTVPFFKIRRNFQDPTILFVCMGNICRSPIAEYLFNHYNQKHKLPYTAKSAGLLETGASISLSSMQLLAEQGIKSGEHSSRKINPEILDGSWLVLTMEARQRDIIRNSFPDHAHKVFTLKEYIGETGDIADPIGRDVDYYRDIYQQIDEALAKLFVKLESPK